jgi:capsular exopolysaccharide synthesis family protein
MTNQDHQGRKAGSLSAREVVPYHHPPGASLELAPWSEGGIASSGSSNSGAAANPFRVRMLLRYKWSILAVSMLVAAPAIAAIWVFIAPQYEATTAVRVSPVIPRLVFKTDDNGLIPLYQSFVNTQVSLICSPMVLERALEQDAVKKTGWYREKPRLAIGTPPTRLEQLRKCLSVKPRPNTEIIDVSMTYEDPNAATIVNAIVNQYLKYIEERTDGTGSQLLKQLTDEHRALKEELDARLKSITELRRSLGTGDPHELVSKMRVRLDATEARLDELKRDLEIAMRQKKRLEERAAKRQDGKASTASRPTREQDYEGDAEWRRLHLNVAKAQHEVGMALLQFGEQHPRIVELNGGVRLAEQLLREREAQLDAAPSTGPAGPTTRAATLAGLNARGLLQGAPRSGGVGALTSPHDSLGVPSRVMGGEAFSSWQDWIDELNYEKNLTTEDQKRQRDEFKRVFDDAENLTKEEMALNRARELYNTVAARLAEKQMESKVPASIEALAPAIPPSEPAKDRRLLLTVMALIAGLGSGLGLAFLRASASQEIREPEDLPRAFSASALGELPVFEEGQGFSPETSAVHNECVRVVRTNLIHRLADERGSVVLVTSPESGCGKTTVALMLARSFAQCGKDVLLVDADLRRPSLAKRLGVPAEPGLLGALSGQFDDEQVILSTETDRLKVLPSGRNGSSFNPELIANGVFEQCLTRWRERYDIVLLDSAPVLAVADAQILAARADGTILVIREGHCLRPVVAEASARLVGCGARLLGNVFIGSSGHSRRYGYGYGYGYGYAGYYSATDGSEEDSRG